MSPPQEAVFFFWHEMALYVGPAVVSDPHSLFCVELTLSLDGSLDLDLAGGRSAKGLGGVLIGSNVAHQHRVHGRRMAQLVVGPLTPAGMALRASLGRRSVRGISVSQIEPFRGLLNRLVASRRMDRAHDTAQALIKRFSPTVPIPATDGRVLRTMDRLLGDFATNAPVHDFARGVGLSESRLSHLFRREVGVPIRTYRRWLRLRAGIILGISGWELADAAHEAGFADQSDFSRSCHKSFGVPPSTITQRPTAVIVGPAEPGCSLMSSLVAGRC